MIRGLTLAAYLLLFPALWVAGLGLQVGLRETRQVLSQVRQEIQAMRITLDGLNAKLGRYEQELERRHTDISQEVARYQEAFSGRLSDLSSVTATPSERVLANILERIRALEGRNDPQDDLPRH